MKDCALAHKNPLVSTTGHSELTDKEKDIIRTTWAKLSEIDTIGVDIFMRIFELIPEVKQFFPFKHAVGDALIHHPVLKSHAMRFFNAIGMTVHNLDAWEVNMSHLFIRYNVCSMCLFDT